MCISVLKVMYKNLEFSFKIKKLSLHKTILAMLSMHVKIYDILLYSRVDCTLQWLQNAFAVGRPNFTTDSDEFDG